MNNKKLNLSLFTALIFFAISSNAFKTTLGFTVKSGSTKGYTLSGLEVSFLQYNGNATATSFTIPPIFNSSSDLICTTAGVCTYNGAEDRLANILFTATTQSGTICVAKVKYTIDLIQYYLTPPRAKQPPGNLGWYANSKNRIVKLTTGSTIEVIDINSTTCNGDLNKSLPTLTSANPSTSLFIQLL